MVAFRLKIMVLLSLLASPAFAGDCIAIDYKAVSLPKSNLSPETAALALAYPDMQIADGHFSVDGKRWLPLGLYREISPAQLLRDPSVIEQFTYVYPLSFDLVQRRVPFNDPGRIRNEDFFHALYFGTEREARASLVAINDPPLGTSIWLTSRRNVACQFKAVLATLGSEEASFFTNPGGGFNWRVISGTSRLSPHSYGIAFDLDPEIGKYWKWTGATEGDVGAYNNEIPEKLVAAMERFGFIWGGKWHHFDGMHFEFRPEIILYARLVEAARSAETK